MSAHSRKTVLSVKNLKTQLDTKFGPINAVDGVSFDLRTGETMGIVGESGSGKSMTALSVLRILPQPAGKIVGGSITLNGESLIDKTDREMRMIRGKELSMILQDPQTSLNPVFKIGGQLIEAMAIHARDSFKAMRIRAIEGLRRVGVAAPDSRINDYPHQMSGGMKQRVVGAIALSCEPKIVIADEPTTSLDVTIQAQYLRLLKDIQNENDLSIIFITHDFGIVAKMCDRLMVMYAGRVVEAGDVRDIFNHPSHPYTDALLKSVPSMSHKSDRLFTIEGQPPALWDMPKGCRFATRCHYADARCHAEYPPIYQAQSDSGEPHTASCWRLEKNK